MAKRKAKDNGFTISAPLDQCVREAGYAALAGLCAAFRSHQDSTGKIYVERDVIGVAKLAHSLGTSFAMQHFAWACDDPKKCNPRVLDALHQDDVDAIAKEFSSLGTEV